MTTVSGFIPAHPRACGENVLGPDWGSASMGSSPRVRGKHLTPSDLLHNAGLIPARAGKTGSARRPHFRVAAHPRACGENDGFEVEAHPFGGSSPRVRGKPLALWAALRAGRLIPARAGKTSSRRRTPWPATAHPRACGENPPHVWMSAVRTGSSPRVRGKPPRDARGREFDGLIPARAGKTDYQDQCAERWTAHPRACGENPASCPTPGICAGSSPRVRGKLELDRLHPRSVGLIPARAGKTRHHRRRHHRRPAHPRACGENSTP